MRILFDQGTPVPLRNYLANHLVETAFELGWSTLKNGDLLAAAEHAFYLLITTDQQLPYQQILAGKKLSILVLMTTSWPRLEKTVTQIKEAIEQARPGEIVEFTPPL